MSGRVGFVGVGNMGFHMANNLMKKGKQVVAFDMVQASKDRVAAAGATLANNPAELAEMCDTVITMLPSNDNVKDVYLGNEGILKTLPKNSLCIDSSTIDPAVSKLVSSNVMENGSEFVDAPVSGGVGGAEKGTLTFMVGGPTSSFERAKLILELMGANIVHCGDVGTGQAAKLCNNMVLAISMIGVSEAMNLGIKLGMDRKKLASILNTSTARCWSSDTYNPAPGVIDGVPSSNNYEGGFASQLMLKDLNLVADAAKAVDANIPMGKNACNFYADIVTKEDYARKDFSVAFRALGGPDK